MQKRALNIRDAVKDTSTSIAVYAKKVWDYVPVLSHPATVAAVDGVVKDYSNFKTKKLIAKAVSLINSEYLELINELKKENAIALRQSGPAHPWNTVGNVINDITS